MLADLGDAVCFCSSGASVTQRRYAVNISIIASSVAANRKPRKGE